MWVGGDTPLDSPRARSNLDRGEERPVTLEVLDQSAEVSVDHLRKLLLVSKVLHHLLNAVDAIEQRLEVQRGRVRRHPPLPQSPTPVPCRHGAEGEPQLGVGLWLAC